jgi:alkaline phosphatase D
MSRIFLPVGVLAFCFFLSTACGGEETVLERIAFGSCNRHDRPQPLWDPIVKSEPQLWIWLGDIVYGDTTQMEELAAKYQAQREVPGYVLLRSKVPVVGTWDDHDYGTNDGDRTFPKKAESQQRLLDFLDVPGDSPRRGREGVYDVVFFGPEGRQVAVILLDVRYHRATKKEGTDILGEAQWKWLEKVLTESRASVHLICSGTQILPTEHRYEKWADYPVERERLLDLLHRLEVPGVVLLSGDRHLAEISEFRTSPESSPLVEITASGMTHSWTAHRGEPNQLRVAGPYTGLHFGLLRIDWERRKIQAEIVDQAGQPALSRAFDF